MIDMERNRNIFLIGPMGAGKTTVGKLLAEQLGLAFLDTDQEIEERTGADISWIFDIEGEEGFRNRESKILDELTAKNGVLIATGGGVVIREENRKCLIGRGTVVYLETSIEKQLERTSRDRKRPLMEEARISAPDTREALLSLNAQREPLYRETADLVFTSDKRSARALATEIAKHFESQKDNSW